jgi:hypothetical protein
MVKPLFEIKKENYNLCESKNLYISKDKDLILEPGLYL